MTDKIRLTVVLASTRNGRRGEKVAQWFLPIAQAAGRFDISLADLAEYNLPFFDDETEPSDRDKQYPDPKVQAWSDTIDAAGVLVFVLPEYNHAVSAPLKNAIDHLYFEWLDKPVGFVGYGSRGAEDSIDSLKHTARALRWRVAPTVVGIQRVKKAYAENGQLIEDQLYRQQAKSMLQELTELYGSAD